MTGTQKISRRHHYIPQFHLKGFLDEEGGLYLFDKKTKKIIKTNTKNVLFEKDRNLAIDPNGEKTDLLEQIYSSIEGVATPVFKKIIEEKHEAKFSNHDKLSLAFHIATLYWRLPTSDKVSDEVRGNKGFNAVPFNLFKKDGTVANDKEISEVLDNENIKKVYRLLLSFGTVKNKDYLRQMLRSNILFNDPGYFLICDNPIIKKNEAGDPAILNEFIVPLSKECLLINNSIVPINTWPEGFFVQMGVAMFEQAERFVCGHDRLFLEKISGYYYDVYKKYNKTDRIIPEIFETIEGHYDPSKV